MSPPRGTWRRRLATLAVAVLVAAGCALAGAWQYGRHVDRSAAVAVLTANGAAEPAPVGDVLAPGVPLAADAVWRAVQARGSYLPGGTVLLRNRPVDGAPGFHVLAAFEVGEGELAGRVLVVDRGWVPIGSDGSSPAAVPDPPVGEVELVARVRPQERTSPRDAPPGQVQAIAVEQVRSAAPEPWRADASLLAYATVVTEDGAQPAGLGALARPSTDLGPHLSYAFQWWVFAVGALVGAVILLVRDARDAHDVAAASEGTADPAGVGGPGRADVTDDVAPAPPAGTGTRRVRSGRRRPTAEQEEDALLDALEDVSPS